MSEQPEKYIGKYAVLAPIGEGGMGYIYKALDPRIRRIVAIKTVRTTGLHDAKLKEFKERFFREAEISGRLHHPNIVTLYEMDEDAKSGDLFIAMEFIDGSPLSAYTQGRVEMDLRLKLKLLSQAADGLDHAHKQGVIHRDVKPSNILVAKTGEAKITDFGIAKVAESDLPQVTRTDTFLGSPRYSSPEQVRGSGVDARSDIFSFGIMSYEFIVGINPFAGSNLSESLYKIAQCLPNLEHTNEQVGYPNQTVKDIFKRVLHSQQDQRYQTAGSFVRELERHLLESPLKKSQFDQSETQGKDIVTTQELEVTYSTASKNKSLNNVVTLGSEFQTKTVTEDISGVNQPRARREPVVTTLKDNKKFTKVWLIVTFSAVVLSILSLFFFQENNQTNAISEKEGRVSSAADSVLSENTTLKISSNVGELAELNDDEFRPALDYGATKAYEETNLKRDRILYLINKGNIAAAQEFSEQLQLIGVSNVAEEELLKSVNLEEESRKIREDIINRYNQGKVAPDLAKMNAELRRYQQKFPEEFYIPDLWKAEIRAVEDKFRPAVSESKQEQVPKRLKTISPDKGFLDRIDKPMRQGRFDLAEQTLTAGLDVFADHPEIKWRAGFLAFQKREFDKASRFFKSLVDSDNDTARIISREFFANQAFLNGEFDLASSLYNEMSSNLLSMTEQHKDELQGIINGKYLINDKLFELVWKENAVDPGSLDDSRWGNRRKANDIEDIILKNPSWLLSGALLVDFFRLNGQKRKAEKLLEFLEERFGGHYFYQETVAAYHFRNNDYREVIRRMGDVVYPSPRLKYYLGLCYFKLGNKVKAKQVLIDLSPDTFPDLDEIMVAL